jgi:hypothetical protein
MTKTVDSYRFLSGIIKRMVKSWIKMEQPRAIPWTPLAKPLSDCTVSLSTLGMALSWLLPDGKATTLYSVQTLRRRKPELYRQDVAVVLDLLVKGQIKPLVAGRLPLSQARQAHELLGSGSVAGKLVLICDLEA